MSFFNGLIIAREQTIGLPATVATTATTAAAAGTLRVRGRIKRRYEPWLQPLLEYLEWKLSLANFKRAAKIF